MGAAHAWPAKREEVEALVRPYLSASLTLDEAAQRMGKSRAALEGTLRHHRIAWREMMQREAPPDPGAFSRQAPALKLSSPEVSKPPPDETQVSEPPPVEWTGARPQSSGVGLERRLAGSDLHVPFHKLRACAAFIAAARVIQPHVILLLGDTWNMGSVSHHPRPFGGREPHERARVQGLSFLDAVARAAPGARKIILKGNHCDWADEYEDENPQFAGMFAAKAMGIDRLGWELIPRSRQPFVLGPVAYAHGSGGGEHYAKRYALHEAPKAGVRCYVVGHHHSMQHHQAKNGCEAWGAGWLGDSRHSAFDYARKNGPPDHWEVGFLIQDVIGDRVTTTPVRVENGAGLYGGRLIAA
jgi:hypothetical protein